MEQENTDITPEETPVAATPPAPGTPEYNAEMAAQGQVALGNVPEKFINKETGQVDMEAFSKSYLELEKQFHEPRADVGDKPEPSDPIDDEQKKDPEAVVEELRVPDIETPEEEVVAEAEAVGITEEDLQGMTANIMRTGNISEEQRTELNQRGVADAVIDTMIDGQRARMRDQYAAAADIVGGADRLSKIFGWAATTLSEAERAQVNAGLSSDASELTLRGLMSKYDASQVATPTTEQEPTRITRATLGNMSSSRPTVQGFGSKKEMYQAMDEAKSNPALMQEYAARMAATPDPTTLR